MKPLSLETIKIDLSAVTGLKHNYNGAIFQFQGNTYLCYRSHEKLRDSSKLGISKVDPITFQPLDYKRLDIPLFAQEDPRVVVRKDKIYVFFNSGQTDYHKGWECLDFHIFVACLNEKLEVEYVKPLRWEDQQQTEKNWCPFYSSELGKWCCIYSIQPWIILAFDENWNATKIVEEDYKLSWPYGKLSGGTSPVFMPPPTGFTFVRNYGYVTFFHSRYTHPVKRYNAKPEYVTGFLMFQETPPFKPMLISHVPLLEASRRSAVIAKVIFASGCYLNDNKWVLSSGDGDRQVRVDIIDHDEIMSSLWTTRIAQ